MYDEAVERGAERHWQSELARRPRLFDGPVWCFRGASGPSSGPSGPSASGAGAAPEEEGPGGGGLEVELQRSSYKYVLYTHHTEEGRQLPQAQRAGACGIMALTQTRDGYLVFGKRSSKVATMPGHWHCMPAGALDSPDLRGVLQKELLEETGCSWDLVKEAGLLAALDSGAEQGHQVEFVGRLDLALCAAELHERHLRAEDRFEHEAILFVRAPARPAGEPPEAGAAASFPRAELDEFLGGEYLLTDVSRRALLLLRELSRPASAAERAADADSREDIGAGAGAP